MRAAVLRKTLLLSILAATCALGAPAAGAQTPTDSRTVVDVAEVFGVLDAQLASDVVARIQKAERDRVALLVLELDTAGALEIDVPALVRAVSGARVPIAVWVGPRRAQARAAGALLVAAAHISAIGPSARLGPLHPAELSIDPASAAGDAARAQETTLARELSRERGRTGDLTSVLTRSFGANASHDAGLADEVVPNVAELLKRSDGRTVTTAAGPVTLRLKSDEVDVRFFKPGPVRGLLHTFATTPALIYVMLLAGAMLVAFEVFQPGFGIAGISGVALLAGAIYGMTILPLGILGVVMFTVGIALLTVDVALNDLGLATIAGTALLAYGSLTMFPEPAGALGIGGWLVAIGVVSALIYFVPVMTLVRRARRDPETQRAARGLVGMPGQVRSMLNPEGFVWVADGLWRARSEDGTRVRVGEDVVVTAADGVLLRVRRS